MGRIKNNIDTFGNPVEDDNDISGFSDEPIVAGNCLSTFSFDDTNPTEEVCLLRTATNSDKTEATNNKITSEEITFSNSSDTTNSTEPNTLNHNSELFDNRRTPIANGAAPQIDGEAPCIRRCYILRESTIRKINELKMMDNDINVCVSTIVDLAIDYYHKLITNTQQQ